MPLYRITAPNGQTYQIEGPEGASDAEVARAVMAQYPDAGAPPKKSTVGSELKRGAQQLASSMQTAYGALTGSPEEAARAGLERGQAISQAAGEGVGFEPVKKAYQEKGLLSAAGEAVSQIPRALAGQGANLATMAGGARLGAMAGSAIAPGVGTVVGGALGAGAALLPQFFGSDVESQAAAQMERGEPVKIDRAKAAAAAAGQAALEGAGTAFTLGKGVVKGVLGIADDAALTTARTAKQLEDTARRSLAGTVGRGAARGAVVEMPVEVAQQVIERAQAGQDLTSAEAFKEYGDAAYQAGLIGGPLGGAGNVVTRGQARQKLEDQAKAEADAKRAELEARGPQVPSEAPAGVQGELFGAAEMGVGQAPKPGVAAAAPAEIKAPQGAQQELGLDYQREFADLTKERERLLAQPQTPEVKARVEELTDQMRSFIEMDIAERRAQAEQDAEAKRQDDLAREKFPALATAPELMAQSDEVKARTQGELFPGEDLGAAPTAEPIAEPTLRSKKEPAPVQRPLGLRRNPEGQPTTFGQPESTITSADIMLTAIPVPKGVEGWLLQNVVGSTPTQLEALIAQDPTLVQGNTPRAKILRALTAKPIPAFEETPRDKTRTQAPAVEQRAEPRAGEPSVGVPVEPAAPVVPEPGAGVAGPAGEPEAPVGLGLVPAGQPAGPGAEAQRGEPAPVADLTQERAFRNALDQEGQALFAKLQDLADRGLATDADIAEAQNIIRSAKSQQEAGFRLFKLLRQIEGAKRPATATPTAAPNPFEALIQPGETTAQTEAPPAAPAKPKSPWDITGPSLHTKDQTSKGTRYAAGTDTGRSVEDLRREIETATGPNADALRAMLKSGKVKLEERHPTMKGVRGLFDGKTVTLYSSGIAEGNALSTALHEVGAHLGMVKLLGQKQYDAVVSKILDWMQLKDGSLKAQLAQAAYRKIPIRDMKRGPEVFGDEAVAYFVEELAAAEAAGKLPKIGPLRAMWNQIKLAITTKLNKLLGTSFGLNDLTPQQIGMMANAAMQSEAKTGVEPTAAADKEMFAVASDTESLIDSLGPLEAEQKSGLQKLIPAFKQSMSPVEPNYAVKFRTQTADAAATIEHRLREKFDGAVRDSLGKLNPMGLYRQAQDHAKLLLEYFQQGSLVKDKTTGLWRVSTVKGVRPPAEVYALIDAWGVKNGYSRERATQIASRILEGVRLDAMRTSNKTEGTEFLLHMKDNEIDRLVREYKADPDLQAMSKLMDEARLAMVDNMVAVGRLSPEQGKAWKEAAGYVPFDRIEDFAERFSKIKKISNKGLAQIGKLPELVGSLERPVGNVFDNYLNTLGWMVGQTMKTDASVQTLRSLEDIGQAKFLGRSALGRDNTVGMYVDGEMMYWELPSKYDLLAFKDLNPPKAGWLRNLGAFSNVLRKSVTVLPPFALKQVTDDVQRAILTSGVRSPGALLRMSLTNFPKLALAELRGIQHPMVREFGALGLTGEYDFQAGKPATSLLKDLGYKKRGKFETLMHRLDGITRASDLSVRKAIYDQTMKETGDQLLAQTRAREFINFRRRGASDFVGAMVTTIPFFNAYIQGMDVLYRAASGKDSSASVDRAQARRLFWSRASTVMMLSSLYALGKDDDDEDYKEMDLRVRDGNWILPGGYKIPVPGELGAIFKVIPERVVEYMKRQGTPEEQDAWEATRTALTYMYEQYIGRATPVPQAIKPVLEAWSNKSFLTGRPLEGFHHQQMEPSMRKTDQTSELAVAIANFSRDAVGVQVSPIMVDNALRGYFGSTAALLTATTDSLLNPTRIDRPLHKWALVSNYMYDPVGTRRMTEFYEEREKVGKAGATLRELLKTDMDRAATYAEEHADELMLESAINSTLQQLEDTRAYRKFLNSKDGAESMSAAEREEALKEIKQMEIGLVSWVREAKSAMR